MKYPEIDQYYADPSPENRDKLMDILEQEHFKISDLGVTSRVFSNWKIKNIIPKVDERQWVRLNLFEYFWIQIIKDLRALGLPLKLIARVKDQLFNHLNLREILFDDQGDFRDDVLRQSAGIISEQEYEQIKSDMEKTLGGKNFKKDTYKHFDDKSGKSVATYYYLDVDRGHIKVEYMDWSKKMKWSDNVNVTINTIEVIDWMKSDYGTK
jgi:hypothetical protein